MPEPIIDAAQSALHSVLLERHAQDAKWGEQNHTDEWWLAILSEEVGEFAKAVLEEHFMGTSKEAIRSEAVQVAAVALAIVECIDRGRGYA